MGFRANKLLDKFHHDIFHFSENLQIFNELFTTFQQKVLFFFLNHLTIGKIHLKKKNNEAINMAWYVLCKSLKSLTWEPTQLTCAVMCTYGYKVSFGLKDGNQGYRLQICKIWNENGILFITQCLQYFFLVLESYHKKLC